MDSPSTKPKSLPLELLRLIFIYLPSKDLKNLRLTCKFLDNIAAEFLLPEVHIVFTTKSINRLKNISLHPVFSQHVTAIFYEGDRLDHYESAEEWKTKVDLDLVDWSRNCDGNTEKNRLLSWKDANLTESEVDNGWKAYERLYKQQQELQDIDNHEREIALAIHRLPKLDTIRLSLESAFGGPSSYLKESFKNGLVIPQGEYSLLPFEPPGLRQYLSLMRGFCVSEKFASEAPLASGSKVASSFNQAWSISPLRVLHLGGTIWLMFPAIPPCVMSDIGASLRHLVELKLILYTGLDRFNELGEEIEICRWCMDKGHLLDFLSSAPNLEKLHVGFDFMFPFSQAASLEYIFGDKTWPKLSHLTIGNVFAPQAQLLSLFKRHQETLRSWSLEGLCLEAGADWKEVLKELRDVSPWKNARVCGDLMVEGEEDYPSLALSEEMCPPHLKVMRSITLFLTREAEEVDLAGASIEESYLWRMSEGEWYRI
ncbi:hypothetical protein MMC30_005727 [Trapelia coarctata]|nr:hypothetical protein [Trapelia coarctata]